MLCASDTVQRPCPWTHCRFGLMCFSPPGGVWLRGDVSEKRLQHPDRLQALYVHLCRHRCAALQGKVFLLYRQLEGHRKGLPVGLQLPSSCIFPCVLVSFVSFSISIAFFLSSCALGVTTLTTGKTKRRWRDENGRDTSFTTTTSSGLCSLSLRSPLEKDGLSECLTDSHAGWGNSCKSFPILRRLICRYVPYNL